MPRPVDYSGKLTVQQEQVIEGVARGQTMAQIAEKMGVTVRTAEGYYKYALDRIRLPDVELDDLTPRQRREAIAEWWWSRQRTPEQEQARQDLTDTPPPEGWPNLRCRRHPEMPLTLGVGGGAWCGLCLKELGPAELEPINTP